VLNTQFVYIFFQFNPALLFTLTLLLLLSNYLFHLKNFLFFKLRDRVKGVSHVNINPLSIKSINILVIFIIITTAITYKYSTQLFDIAGTSISYNKNPTSLFIISLLITTNLNYVFSTYFKDSYCVNYNQYISILFSCLFFFILSTENLLIFFIFIELFTYLFYLQFIQLFNFDKNKNVSNFYIDSIILYYWANFFGSIIIIYSIFMIYLQHNTVNFKQLQYFSKQPSNTTSMYILVLGLAIKMGLPGLHMFKVEVYKNLRVDAILNFSFLSVLGYVLVLNTVLYNIDIPFTFYIVFTVIFICIFLTVVPVSFRIINTILFFGYSAMLNTTLCLFLVL
jgi:hypothetical protein